MAGILPMFTTPTALLRQVVLAAVVLVVTTAAGRAAPITNLQGYWQFNGNGFDSSGNNRHLTLSGGPGFGTGLLGQALSLTGIPTQFATRPVSDAVFDLGASDFTMQIWVNFNNTSGEQTLFEKFTGVNGPGYSLTKLPSNVLRFTLPSNNPLDSMPLAISLGSWHQFIARRSGTTIELFFDGTVVATGIEAGSYNPSPNPLLLGERQGPQQFPVNGLIDEAAFWNRSLSNDEVAQVYNNGAGLDLTTATAVPEPGGLALFSLLAAILGVYRLSSASTAWRALRPNRCAHVDCA